MGPQPISYQSASPSRNQNLPRAHVQASSLSFPQRLGKGLEAKLQMTTASSVCPTLSRSLRDLPAQHAHRAGPLRKLHPGLWKGSCARGQQGAWSLWLPHTEPPDDKYMPLFTDVETDTQRDPGLESDSDPLTPMTFSSPPQPLKSQGSQAREVKAGGTFRKVRAET